MTHMDETQERSKTNTETVFAAGVDRVHSRRMWLKVLGVLLLAFASYHIGWFRAMSYFGATWDTPRGSLEKNIATPQLPSHLLICTSTLPRECYDYRCPVGTHLVDPEQYSLPDAGSREKKCSDDSTAVEVRMSQGQ
jgi:hypothetical protein